MDALLGFTICCLVGVLCFYAFLKCIDWFENI